MMCIRDRGKPVSKNKVYQLRDGIFEAIIDKFYTDPTLIAYGEDNRDWGGAFAVYRGLTEALPYQRFFNSPISEAAIDGSAVGYAMSEMCIRDRGCGVQKRNGICWTIFKQCLLDVTISASQSNTRWLFQSSVC